MSVLTAYLCCQIRRWIALFAVACIGGGSNTQEVAELIVTLPLLWGLLKFVAPSVRAIGRTKPSVQVFFGIMPALSYAFDYLTRVYTDLLVQGVIDLCFLENGAWVLVDYKTDRCPAEELPAMYGDQLRWYARALREITGLPVRFGGLYSLRRRTLVPVEV